MHQYGRTLVVLYALLSGVVHAEMSWQTRVDLTVPKMGHRNWIVIVDAAYPWQIREGVETVLTGSAPLEVIKGVLASVERAPHVQPKIYVDRELAFVSEEDAPGIADYREKLNAMLKEQPVHTMLHEDIIAMLDKAGETFHVLVLKTDQVLPYTSVFLQLECGYWSSEAEASLRKRMAEAGGDGPAAAE